MGQLWVILANQLACSGEGGTTWFFFLLLYDQSIQSGHWTSIVYCSNWFPDPSHEHDPALSCCRAGGWSVGSPVPPALEPGSSEPCRLNHDRYLGNKALAGASQKVLFTVITAPVQAVRAEARRLGLESTHSLHLRLIYPVSLGWEGQAREERLLQSPAGPADLTPQAQGLSHIFCIHHLNQALSFKAQLKILPLGSASRCSPDQWVGPSQHGHAQATRKESGWEMGRTQDLQRM